MFATAASALWVDPAFAESGMMRQWDQSTPIDTVPRANDPQLRELAMRALDAAKSAGATYADVRLTLTRRQSFYYGNAPIDSEHIAVGIRALVNGAWGFVAGPRWTLSEMSRLGKDAVDQARANAWDGVPPVDIGTLPTQPSGTWAHPVVRDPLTVPLDEKLDYIRSAESLGRSYRNSSASSVIVFERQDRTFASTEGAFGTQVLYNSLGNGSFFVVSAMDPVTQRRGSRGAGFVSPTSAGFEIFDNSGLIDLIPQLYEEAREQLTAEPILPSRYDVVFDASAMAAFVDRSIGAALELDRALGLEANAAGTSYLAPVATTVGTQLGTTNLTITAERSHSTGAATVKWDDDGVAPEPFTLIKNGVVNDYVTNREHVGALTPWYQKQNIPVRSHGCANSETAMDIPLIHLPNLHMVPNSTNTTFADLIAEVEDGVAILGGGCSMDQQMLTGQGRGEMAYRIRRGKLAGTVSGATYLFRSPELWKNIVTVGGESTANWRGMTVRKGQPSQTTVHSVHAVAALVKNVTIANPRGD